MRTLEKGSSFGELALTIGGKRSATIKCIEDCEFATLNKESFVRSLQSISLKRIRKKVEFFQEIPIFRLMSHR